MRTVRSFACERVEGDRFYDKLTTTLSVTRTKAIAYVGFIWVSEVSLPPFFLSFIIQFPSNFQVFQTFIIVAVLWYGGHLVLSGKMKKELLVSFLLYQMQLGDNLRQMGEVWTGLMQSVGASRKVSLLPLLSPPFLHLSLSLVRSSNISIVSHPFNTMVLVSRKSEERLNSVMFISLIRLVPINPSSE